MITQIEMAKRGEVSPQAATVAKHESLEPEFICRGIASGKIVVPVNALHKALVPRGFGEGLATKVNANIGTSTDFSGVDIEMEKLAVAIKAGADAVMDLSTGGDIVALRRAVVAGSPIPVGSVPIYQAGVKAIKEYGAIVKMTADDIFEAITDHARDGIDFVTVHCGVTQAAVARLREQGRVTDIVSRGGSFLTAWMLHNEAENPLYEQYDRLLDICREFDLTLSLGDGLRPGCQADATDRAQIEELLTLGELVKRSRAADVQVMVEGPGHIPLHQIEANVRLQKSVCDNAPFYVLGPLVTDVAAGYDHITGAIGGALAAWAGADFLCYVTPAEHLGLPEVEDVRQGVIASRIAAHAADIAKGVKRADQWDLKMSLARKNLDWAAQAQLSLDPERARQVRGKRTTSGEACSMCGDFCAMEITAEHLGGKEKPR
jgi:phosphomethylpyrimidine synthase